MMCWCYGCSQASGVLDASISLGAVRAQKRETVAEGGAMAMDGNGGAEQAVNLCVGLRVPWKQVLKVLGRWHSQGNPALTSDPRHKGSNTKAYKCVKCDFQVSFAKRKSKQAGGADEGECVHISEEHEPGCHATAPLGGVVRVVSPDSRICYTISHKQHEAVVRSDHSGRIPASQVREEVGEMLPTGEEPGVLGRAGMATDSRKRPAHLQTSQTARTKPFVQVCISSVPKRSCSRLMGKAHGLT
jgi:hypothetical protein